MKIIDLRKPDLRIVDVGTIVTTSKNFGWELAARDGDKESWLDIKSGLTWHDPKVSGINHYKAQEMFGDKLPTKEEYELAEAHGIREVMDLKGRFFWSSSVHPNLADVAYGFDGSNGYIDYGARSGSLFDASVCVQRESK